MSLRKRVLAGAAGVLFAGAVFGGCGPIFGGGGGGGGNCPVVQYCINHGGPS